MVPYSTVVRVTFRRFLRAIQTANQPFTALFPTCGILGNYKNVVNLGFGHFLIDSSKQRLSASRKRAFEMNGRTTQEDKRIVEASIKTSDDLKAVAGRVSHLTLPEIEAVSDLIGQLAPAGNVPSVILSGMSQLEERTPPPGKVKRDVNLLFRGVEQVLNKAAYVGLAGAASVLLAYQNILKLAGKDPAGAFPRGVWQFYVDYALREDTARHATETVGFDTILGAHGVTLDQTDRIASWVMASIYCLHHYDRLLANEWRERMYTQLLDEIVGDRPDTAHYRGLYVQWLKRRPYARGQDVNPLDDYATYRRKKFDAFMEQSTRDMPGEFRERWKEQCDLAEQKLLPDYVDQMSILAYLEPESYGEEHYPIMLEEAQIGVIYRDHYYVIPVCKPGTRLPLDWSTVRSRVASFGTHPPDSAPANLAPLARVQRSAIADLKKHLRPELVKGLNALRQAPILLNFDTVRTGRDQPLAELRLRERGIGSHALTVFDTGGSFIFDVSHIFFDGVWAVTLAEILTGEALSWATYLRTLATQKPSRTVQDALDLNIQPEDMEKIARAPHVTPEVGAETTAVDMKAILQLRKLFKQRNDLIKLTVNDILVLYRAIHAATYQPDPALFKELHRVAQDGAAPAQEAAEAAIVGIQSCKQANPILLIPVDASRRLPSERVYPVAFEVPIEELNLLGLYEETTQNFAAYKSGGGNREALYEAFDEAQRDFLATLAGFGQLMDKLKAFAVRGETSSVSGIKFLARAPAALRRILDAVPERFEMLNDIMKGREVFSNIGAVAPSSTLSRFVTAKDDNDRKTFAWGVMTDADHVMHLTLRDFRPHVAKLIDAGHRDLAIWIAQDYVDAYAKGLNTFIQDVHRITLASRETRFTQLEALHV